MPLPFIGFRVQPQTSIAIRQAARSRQCGISELVRAALIKFLADDSPMTAINSLTDVTLARQLSQQPMTTRYGIPVEIIQENRRKPQREATNWREVRRSRREKGKLTEK